MAEAYRAKDPEGIEFDCEGCGDHVFAYGIHRVPLHGLCNTCAWLCENVPDPEEMIRLHHHIVSGNGQRHAWRRSHVGHGEAQCRHCLITNREAWAIGERICPGRSPTDQFR